MDLPKLQDNDLREKRVLVRADLDVGNLKDDNFRLEAILPTLRYLYDSNCEIILCGHRGRPGGKAEESLGMESVGRKLEEILILKWGEEDIKRLKLQMMENLRFNVGEENNDDDYAKHLAEKGDFFVNEAFAASHRKHASIVSLPKHLPHAAGIRFVEEVENLSNVTDNGASITRFSKGRLLAILITSSIASLNVSCFASSSPSKIPQLLSVLEKPISRISHVPFGHDISLALPE